ncbi:hypothetical protein ACFFKE_00770 [Streptomyces mutabilis]|nr:hypothetical protein [Streptomyces mutabilis]
MTTVAIVDVDRVWFMAAHGLHGVTEIDRGPASAPPPSCTVSPAW